MHKIFSKIFKIILILASFIVSQQSFAYNDKGVNRIRQCNKEGKPHSGYGDKLFNPAGNTEQASEYEFFTSNPHCAAILSTYLGAKIALQTAMTTCGVDKVVSGYPNIIKDYYSNKIKSINKIKQISKKINFLKKHKETVFFGAGKILNTFFENGLNTKNVKFLIDNFLSGKIKENHNLKIYNSNYLKNKKFKNLTIFIFARDAEDEIYDFLKKNNFRSVIKISNYFK